MDQEISTKAKIYGIIAVIIIVILYVVWTFFLNKGTVSITAQTPFSVTVNGTTENCTTTPCDIVLAPGYYSFTLEKEGYKSYVLQTNVPVLGTNSQTVDLTFIPVLTELGLESDLNLFAEAPSTFDVYIERSKENGRQTLYYLPNEPNSAPTIATSFTRDLKDFFIEPAIDTYNKIAVVDVTDSQATLYLVDLEQKTRNAVLSLPMISGLKWVDATHLIIEGRTDDENTAGLHYFDLTTQAISPINIETTLQNIVPLDQTTLLATTKQPFTSVTPLSPVGEVVNLSASAEESASNLLLFIKYSLESNTSRLLISTEKPKTCSRVLLSSDKQHLSCLAPIVTGDKVFELTFEQ